MPRIARPWKKNYGPVLIVFFGRTNPNTRRFANKRPFAPWERGWRFRKDLVAITGLSKQSVHDVLNDFLKAGIIHSMDLQKRGHKARRYIGERIKPYRIDIDKLDKILGLLRTAPPAFVVEFRPIFASFFHEDNMKHYYGPRKWANLQKQALSQGVPAARNWEELVKEVGKSKIEEFNLMRNEKALRHSLFHNGQYFVSRSLWELLRERPDLEGKAELKEAEVLISREYYRLVKVLVEGFYVPTIYKKKEGKKRPSSRSGTVRTDAVARSNYCGFYFLSEVSSLHEHKVIM